MQLNLESFSKEATYCIYKNASLFSSFEELFEFLYKIALDERIIIAIDEYPYLAKAYPEISSLLQKYIDSKFKDTRLMLILCGSSMSFMENQVLGYQSPLYGRRTAQMKILPFDYRETALMFPHYTYEEKAGNFYYDMNQDVSRLLQKAETLAKAVTNGKIKLPDNF